MQDRLLEEHVPENFFVKDIKIHKQNELSIEARYWIFATPKQLQLLAKAKVWYMDGTYYIMKKPFQQLYSIHAFVRSGSTTKQVPLCYIMMSQQQATDYKVVLQAIIEKIIAECGSGISY